MKKITFKLCDKDITRLDQISTNPPCPSCGSSERRFGCGKGPHSASLMCGECDRFIKWVGKAELARIVAKGVQR